MYMCPYLYKHVLLYSMSCRGTSYLEHLFLRICRYNKCNSERIKKQTRMLIVLSVLCNNYLLSFTQPTLVNTKYLLYLNN